MKECPKCHGDLLVKEDVHGQYVSCIQCGFLRDLPQEVAEATAWETIVIDEPETVKKSRIKISQAA